MPNSALDDGQKFVSGLQCAQCSQRRSHLDLTLCSKCSYHPDGRRMYICTRHCCEESCGHTDICGVEGHMSCWHKHISGLSTAFRETHEKYSTVADGCIQAIIPAIVDDDVQRKHHQSDRDAEWFRVTMARTAQGDQPYLEIANRFKRCCDPGRVNYWTLNQYPSLVSFIGDTGAGKSTLVRAVMTAGLIEPMIRKNEIDWSRVFGARKHGPVTRPTSAQKTTLPTSSGVNLYRDRSLLPVKYDGGRQDDVPILFADCEGFNAGSMITEAELSVVQIANARSSRARSGSDASDGSRSSDVSAIPADAVPKMQSRYLAEEIQIRAPDFKERGKTSAELFYARFLYAFSDVVVYVIKEDQQMKRAMQRLLEWAVSAVKMSIRRNSPRTLIVVRNGPRRHDDSFYDDADLKNEIFRDFGEIWDDSLTLSRYRDVHNDQCTRQEDKIFDNEQYFKLAFRETKICYVPDVQNRQPPDKLYNQYVHLRRIIIDSVISAQKTRVQNLMHYDVPSLTHLINRAFRHFAEEPEAFDFHLAARRNNPTPISIPGHIANLLRHFGLDCRQLQRFQDVVAIGLISYNYRTHQFGGVAEEIFDNDLAPKCIKGIEIYQERFLRCALVMGDDTQCVNYAYNHGTQHCSEKSLIWNGTLDRSGFPRDATDIVASIKTAFIHMYAELWTQKSEGSRPRCKQASQYRCQILGRERDAEPTLSSLARNRTLRASDFNRNDSHWLTVKSNMTCFACLQYPPDHVLPCGHGFCEECVKDFGEIHPSKRYHLILDRCVLCGSNAPKWHKYYATDQESQYPKSLLQPKSSLQPQVVKLNPHCGGIRILTLDGGGIRGIIELAIIEKIEERIGLKLPITEFFDLVVGTSTGGIIALAETSCPRRMSSSQLSRSFMELAKKVFQKDRFGGGLNWAAISTLCLFLRLIKSRYQSRKLKAGLLEIFDQDQPIFGDAPVTGRQRLTRVAVTATHDGEPCLFSNFNRAAYDCKDLADRDHLVDNKGFERQDNPTVEAKVWEAAMATSAAPPYFHEWRVDDLEKRQRGQVPFADGALACNLPVDCALRERDRIWPEYKGFKKPLDILVSIGTGKQPEIYKIPKWMDVAGAGDLTSSYIKNIFNTDMVWESFTSRSTFDKHRHVRLTIDLDKQVDLDAWDKMQQLYDQVDKTFRDSQLSREPRGLWMQVNYVAYMLTASLLFFEPQKWQPAGRRESVIGQIWCRLELGSDALRSFVSRIDGFYHQLGSGRATRLSLKDEMLHQQRSSQPLALDCAIDNTGGDSVQQSILIGLRPPTSADAPLLVPISGFPITFNQMRAAVLQRENS